ncbi:leukocyte cell-derived chemotaxin-2 [Hippocampus comes]|uniref:leukocyte cell-derived chemotaxin-2 n=1 Tax=Hippocampus comes TaxID=109280 RepID=UPI00094E0E50|nr:PREDICTED: leukocyte cell-derived chemotaxin-2-like [Hippocampus comes]XP_019728906.1 PREDICTED: leukocyte cell-derived chemotaxin-2-like [Hippocampus comes]
MLLGFHLAGTTLLLCYVLLSCASEHDKRKGVIIQSPSKNADGAISVMRNDAKADDGRPRAVARRRKVKKAGSRRTNDTGCTRLGGICQPNRFVCQGRYLTDKCSGPKTRLCCMPVGAWSVLCAGHYNNRVRSCDMHGCGTFNSRGGLNRTVDLVCADYAAISAPFSGSLAGPVSQKDAAGFQYDGVKLVNDEHCVKIFNIRPFRYTGMVALGEPLGYVLPLQEHFAGITSHLKLQMCDGTDPSPFI